MSESSQDYLNTFLRKPAWWDRALGLCVQKHRLPAAQIPCVACQTLATATTGLSAAPRE